jgi:hypothetical protein
MPDFSDLTRPPAPSPQSDPTQLPDFSDLKAQPDESFGAHVSARVRGIVDAFTQIGAAAGEALAIGGDLEAGRMASPRIQKLTGQLGETFGGMKDEFKASPGKAIAKTGASLVKGLIIQPTTDFLRFASGYDPGTIHWSNPEADLAGVPESEYVKRDPARELSSDEIYEASKATTANVVAVVVGEKAAQATTEAFSGLRPFVGSKGLAKIGKAASKEEIASVIEGAGMGAKKAIDASRAGTLTSMPWAQRSISGLVGGVAGGGAFGAASASSNEDALSAALTMAIVAAPLGLAMSVVGEGIRRGRGIADKSNYEVARNMAADYAALRSRGEIYDNAPLNILYNADNLQEVKSLQALMARRAVDYDPLGVDPKTGQMVEQGRNAAVIPSVDAATIPEVLAELQPVSGQAEVMSVIHARGDGMHDILIAPTDTPAHVQDFFSQTGYLQGQQVTYGGNDRWVIQEATKPKGARNYQLTLRNMVTEQHIEGVKISDVLRPGNKYLGELALYQTRQIRADEIFDPSLGIAIEDNTFTQGSVAANPTDYNSREINVELGSTSGYMLDDVAQPTKFLDAADGTEVPMKEGMNVLSSDKGGGIIDTNAVYVKNGQPVAILSEHQTPRADGTPVRRSSGQWHFQNTDPATKSEASLAMAKYRAENKITGSNSSLSPGAQKSRIRALNENWYGRTYSEFGVYNAAAFMQDITTSFLDHIGLIGDKTYIPRTEVIDRIGRSRPRGEPVVAQPGETLATVERRREGLPERLYGPPNPQENVVYKTAEGEMVTSEKQARAHIAYETEAGHIPEVSTRPSAVDPLSLTTDLTFDEYVDSWAGGMNLKPEVKQAIKNHLEFEFGRLLRGDSETVGRYTNKITANTWEARVGEINKAIALENELTSPNEVTRIEAADKIKGYLHLPEAVKTIPEVVFAVRDAKLTKSIFEARIEQLRNPTPLELSPSERAKVTELLGKAQQERMEMAQNLVDVAHSNGYFAERGFGGAIELRDMDTNLKLPVSFFDEPTAAQWIKETGRVNAMEIDGGTRTNMVPPESVGGGGLTPPPGQAPLAHELPYEFTPDTKVGKYLSLFDSLWPRLTTKRGFLTSIDQLFDTKLFEDVYQPLQTAKMLSIAKKRPYLEQLKTQVEEVLEKSGLPRKDWGRVEDYRQTRSVSDLDVHLFGDRIPNQAEKDMSEKLAAMNIDVKKVYEYNRDVEQIRQDARVDLAKLDPNDPATPQKQAQIQQATQIKLDDRSSLMDAQHMNAAQMFEMAKRQDPDQFRLDIATRRARAIMSKEPTRSVFAEQNKMSNEEILAAEALDRLYADVATSKGLTPNFTDYVTHSKANGEGVSYPVNLRDRKLQFAREKETAELAGRLVDSGEMGNGSRDPVHNAINFINKVVDYNDFDVVWNDARNATVRHIKALPGKAREYASRVAGEYLYGMRGVPNAHDSFSREMTKKFFEDTGMMDKNKALSQTEQQLVGDVADIMLASSSAALLGGRPAQGIRDLHGFMRNYYARFGAGRTMNGFRLAFERNPKTGRLPIYELAEQGKVPGLSILQFLSEEEVAQAMAGKGTHTVRDAIFQASKLGLVTSGQHNVYALAHAVSYLETSDFASKTLLELSREKISKSEAYKRLKINGYDIPVAQGFDRLVTEGKFNEATEYLAQVTGTETAFVYGLQNHPYGWGSKSGRLMGQFGQWSIWDRDFLARIARRGTAGERAAAMTRYAVSEAALWAFGRATGFNVKSWYGVPGVLFAGSPLMGLASQVTEMAGLRGKQRQREALSVYGGKIPLLSQFLPGASAFSDYYQAYRLNEAKYGPLPVMGKALGFAVDRSQRSWADEAFGYFPTGQRP